MTTSIDCRSGIKCPHCGHTHDATDNEIDGHLSGHEQCEECDREFWFFAEYDVTWNSQTTPL